jgi:hypothetical protein
MSEKSQINPAISATLRDQLRDACQARHCSQGELVEAALTAYLAPTGDSQPLDLVMAKLTSLEKTLAALVEVCEHLTPAQPPVASYDAMYGPIAPAVVPSPPPTPPPAPLAAARWWAWLFREVTHGPS